MNLAPNHSATLFGIKILAAGVFTLITVLSGHQACNFVSCTPYHTHATLPLAIVFTMACIFSLSALVDVVRGISAFDLQERGVESIALLDDDLTSDA